MKGKIILAAMIGVGLQVVPSGRASAEEPIADVFINAFSRPPESSRNDRHDDDRYEPRRHDESSRPSGRDRYESRRHDESSSPSRRDRNDPDSVVRRAYQDILNREPDQAGLRTYRSRIIDDHWSEQDVRSDLRKSDERAGRTPAAAELIVRRAYQDILGRDPDAAGLATYRAKLLSEGWSERDIRSDLKNSPEYRNKQNKK
ncbi:MAG: hypothetical protein WCI20_08235 [bacterium]